MKRHPKDAPVPPAPPGLSPEAVHWWNELHREFDLDDSAARLLLETALRAHDRMAEAAKLIAEHGVCIRDKWGQLKPNPAAQVERDSRSQMLLALKALNLDLLPSGKPGRPPGR